MLSPLALKACGKNVVYFFVYFFFDLMAIFAFGVSGEYPCQSEFIPRFKLQTMLLNVLEVHGITASMKIHRWTNEKKTSIISRW